ncbi:hypothetical protein DFA_06397 [Cavenderia fasciculata]|uniref:Paramecium surface antigen repeat-containing protein n=1 Tax=Cavenderia fasciculata TaxID=261658 RepID=F4PIW1_CACFS|nr:uncharacterized protein DFA_06397 [Cavenderia fasciculata]EGG24247.1 hypothetical protein DFA_06397 [Cavenderia fasciculata]|eukprot:XP_004362098.1 hypothetical protein DFA_06397 [Cavenderia fasciculata]
MMKQIIVICILSSLLIVGSSAQQRCSSEYEEFFVCVEESERCNGTLICGYGYGCLPNPYVSNPTSVLAELDGGSSYEPVAPYICIRLGAVGSPCYYNDQCMDGLDCYNPHENGTCQHLYFAQLGEDCRFDQECYPNLKCDPFERECVADIGSDLQCQNNVQCSYGFQCNSTSNRCVPRASAGQVCRETKDGFSYMYCQEDLLCNSDTEGNYTCVTPFSIATDKGCFSESEKLNGDNGYYLSPCQAGTVCHNNLCTALNITAASVNCSSDVTQCSFIENCECNNGTYIDGVAGQCVAYVVSNTETINKCIEHTTNLLGCLKDNECSDYSLSRQGEAIFLVPNSCGYRNCHSELCDIQAECTAQPPSPAPSCGEVDLDEKFFCADYSSASTLTVSGSILFALIVALLF